MSSWHIIAQIGRDDTFFPDIADTEGRLRAVLERSDDEWYVSNNAISTITDVFRRSLRPEAEDLLNLALSVYTADLLVPRKKAQDRWTRDFVVYVPVYNIDRWHAAREIAARALNFLTGDKWDIRFRERGQHHTWAKESKNPVPTPEKVCLFSGGLDSLVGAIDLLSEGDKVALVGHHGAGVTNVFQTQTLGVLERHHKDQTTPFMFYAQPPKKNVPEGEPSMRSRSFLFFAMGVAVASAVGDGTPLVVAENGFISLNIPLTPSRAGTLSTRTTHPHYVQLFAELIDAVALKVPLILPYRFETKGEMLAECARKNGDLLAATTPLTMSCSHAEAGRFRGFSPKDHCGYCVPCIIRRAATVASGTPDSAYGVDVRTDPPDHGTDSGRDTRAFEMAVERSVALPLGKAVFKILGPGPLPSDDIRAYAAMYLRGLAEIRSFFHPAISR